MHSLALGFIGIVLVSEPDGAGAFVEGKDPVVPNRDAVGVA